MRLKAKEFVQERPDILEKVAEEAVEETTSQPSDLKAEKFITTMKKIVWFLLFNGVAWVWCSYILAALGKEQIAESLSQVALKELIAVVFAYAFKSVVENLSKNNNWPDKSDKDPPAVG